MAIKVLKKKHIKSRYADIGDTIQIRYKGNLIVEKDIDKPLEFDTAIIFKLTNQLGLSKGIGGIIGKKK